MSALTLREIARALGGEVQGRQVLAPGPGHSPGDRSLSVRMSHQSPSGFVVFSHSGDDFKTSRDYVARRLGLGPDAWKREKLRQFSDSTASRQIGEDHDASANLAAASDDTVRIDRAAAIWNGAIDAHGTCVERYLDSRGLELPDGADVLRFHPRCPWGDKALGRTFFVPAMVAAMRAIDRDIITAVHRTRLTLEGVKVERMMLGKASGAAIKLNPNDEVTLGLHLAEGIETALAGRQLGFRPAWALGSAGGIKAFPVLGGVECLTILAEHDETNSRAVEACAARWHAAGREVVIVEPASGSDLNDALRGAA